MNTSTHLEELDQAQRIGQLHFFGEFAPLSNAGSFADWLAPLRTCERVVYAKHPFAGPAAVLAYLSRYTHRVAISNQRLVALDKRGVTFRWKDYRTKGRTRYKTMTLATDEFMRRFLLHVMPTNAELQGSDPPAGASEPTFFCRACGVAMVIIKIVARGQPIRAPPQRGAL